MVVGEHQLRSVAISGLLCRRFLGTRARLPTSRAAAGEDLAEARCSWTPPAVAALPCGGVGAWPPTVVPVGGGMAAARRESEDGFLVCQQHIRPALMTMLP